jgi:hypothetical protein
MNTKLVDSLVTIIKSLTEEEQLELQLKISNYNQSVSENSDNIRNEPFVGMWQNREDMANSSQWVKKFDNKSG